MVSKFIVASIVLCGFSSATLAMDQLSLQKTVERRLLGDRTGACWAVAVVTDSVSKSMVCANPAKARALTAQTPFEIGSVTKTMNGFLLNYLMEQKKLSIDDPIAKHLPAGTVTPEFNGQPILLKHLVAHSSGLPALPTRFAPANASDPYADLTEAVLLGSLADIKLSAAPGTASAYSNWGAMILSLIISRVGGTDYETLINDVIFLPFGMKHSFIVRPPVGVRMTQGHLSTGQPTSPWNLPVNFAGVGGVRASLDDMVVYARAQMKRVSQVQSFGWNKAPIGEGGSTVWFHEGGTGGFSSLVSFDDAGKRAVVILSDTSLTSLGGLGSLGIHLMNPARPVGAPRQEVPVPKEILSQLLGEYRFAAELGNMGMTLVDRGGKAVAIFSNQPDQILRYDSAGDFFFNDIDALLRPNKRSDGSYSFQLFQGGGVYSARKVETTASPLPTRPSLSVEQLEEYVGNYQIAPTFAVQIASRNGGLTGQATGQGAFALEPVRKDVFGAEQFGIEMVFKRDAGGKITSFDLYQGGRITPAVRQ
jgi:serine-type D-Ala-D-Ala carboxypeptidase/endopeptidase